MWAALPSLSEVTSGEYRHQWRNYFRQQVFAEFAPDMIFLSAGFDAHRKDAINVAISPSLRKISIGLLTD